MSDTTSKPPSHRDDALAVLMRLREAGHVAYFAGGCVRDLLLGLPAKDFDVATDAPPDVVQKLFPNSHAIGAAFGVILVRQRKSMIEVATFRTDGNYSDGRRPDSVRFTTAEEDAQRRDFTINGLFLDPVADKIIDYVGGQADLQAKLIRAIGDPAKRFEEDYLRMLRAVRFAARLGFEIEPATAEAIRRNAPSIARISPERIADELRRILMPPSRVLAWSLLQQCDLVANLFRGLVSHSRSDLGLLRWTDPIQPISFPLALAVCLIDFPASRQYVERNDVAWIRSAGQKLRQLFKLSNEERDALAAILHDGSRLLHETLSRASLMRFLAKPTSTDTRRLLKIIQADQIDDGRAARIELQLAPLESLDCAPPPLVTGDDLTAAGLSPGPIFKRVLDAVYDAQLESRVNDRSAAMEMAMKLAAQEYQ